MSECKTEEQIKQYAKELFFARGIFNASTQEIADFAGVNRTLVNYYFRSKNHLFELVYWESIGGLRDQLAKFYSEDVSLREKVENIIDYLSAFRQEYPFLEVFNVQETVKLTNSMESIFNPKYINETKVFFKQVEEEMEKGTITKSDPRNFLINLMSLVSYPIIMRPVFERILEGNQQEFDQLYQERKQTILNILFNQTN